MVEPGRTGLTVGWHLNNDRLRIERVTPTPFEHRANAKGPAIPSQCEGFAIQRYSIRGVNSISSLCERVSIQGLIERDEGGSYGTGACLLLYLEYLWLLVAGRPPGMGQKAKKQRSYYPAALL